MNILRSRTSASLAALAATVMTVSPAMAHGWGRYPGPPRHHHHHRGGGGGGLLAGLLIGGGFVAIASAASKSNQPERVARPRDAYEDDDYGRDYERGDDRPAYPGGPVVGDPGYAAPYEDDRLREEVGASGFGMAVDTCTDEVEGGSRYSVRSVDKVDRMNGRVAVEGRLKDGRGFACSIDGDGRVRSVAVDGRAMI
ncbi:hypothetical protein [Novosphingobium sp. BW1]|uniref:hypothetical protein n=1 Tax=Novosphingobium sp. BW1 TaxID=2592621 RepID=UPI001F071CB0|nr:hypothetical protein [Novosphingobium sp. BW1]